MTDDTTATAGQLHALFGVKPGTARQWYARGRVRRRGRNAYVVADVVRILDANQPDDAPTDAPPLS